MVRKFQSILLALLIGGILVCPALAASPFPDVDENAEYVEAVEYLKDAGIMQGDGNGNFNPNQSVTRAEMAAIVCRMLGETDDLMSSDTFTDVPAGHWANEYVTRAAELGIVNGYGGGKFGPEDRVTYEQAVTMVVRALGGSDLAQTAGGYPNGFFAVADMYGFLSGVNAERGSALSRAYVAIILYNSYGFYFDS